MTKRELIQHLLDGKKMTTDKFDVPDETYCIYDDNYDNPFRYIRKLNNSPMVGVWDYTNWREVKEKYYGWRLPTIKELLTLVKYDKVEPACNFIDTKLSYYWTSTLCLNRIWVIDFRFGDTVSKLNGNTYYVRYVRERDGKLEWSKSSTNKMTHNEALKYAKSLTDEDIYKGK